MTPAECAGKFMGQIDLLKNGFYKGQQRKLIIALKKIAEDYDREGNEEKAKESKNQSLT